MEEHLRRSRSSCEAPAPAAHEQCPLAHQELQAEAAMSDAPYPADWPQMTSSPTALRTLVLSCYGINAALFGCIWVRICPLLLQETFRPCTRGGSSSKLRQSAGAGPLLRASAREGTQRAAPLDVRAQLTSFVRRLN